MSNQPKSQPENQPQKSTIVCSQCQHVNSADQFFCLECNGFLIAKTTGKQVEAEQLAAPVEKVEKEGSSTSTLGIDRICPECRHHNKAGVVRCDECGKNLMRAIAQEGSTHPQTGSQIPSIKLQDIASLASTASDAGEAQDLFESMILDGDEVKQHIANALDEHQARLTSGTKPPTGVLEALQAARHAIKQGDSSITGIDEVAVQQAVMSADADSSAPQESHQPDAGARSKNIAPPLKSLADVNGRLPTNTFRFESDMVLRMEFAKRGKSIDLHMVTGKPYTIGRHDPTQNHNPAVDITEIYGDARGVSRSHAELILKGNRIELRDLNSTNGTFLNGLRFAHNEVHEIRSGDSISLAHISLHIYFHVETDELVDQAVPTGALNNPIHKIPTAPLSSH